MYKLWTKLLGHTVCPISSYPFYILSYNIKWVTTSWTHSMSKKAWPISYGNILYKTSQDLLDIKWDYNLLCMGLSHLACILDSKRPFALQRSIAHKIFLSIRLLQLLPLYITMAFLYFTTVCPKSLGPFYIVIST